MDRTIDRARNDQWVEAFFGGGFLPDGWFVRTIDPIVHVDNFGWDERRSIEIELNLVHGTTGICVDFLLKTDPDREWLLDFLDAASRMPANMRVRGIDHPYTG